jgi:hypothetical protein
MCLLPNVKNMQMLYVDNLQHGFDTSPFSIPRCAFLDSKTIDAIANKDLRGDVPPGTTEFGHLRVSCNYIVFNYCVSAINPN